MAKKTINTGSALGPYSSAVVAGEHCYIAGTGGFLPGTSTIVDGGIEAEIRQAMDNLEATLARAGFALADVVSVTCYLRHTEHWPVLNEVYRNYFTKDEPARASLVVAGMPANASFEITCVAWRGKDA
ncbi:RidA family protein [Amycolatopsis saalfeldensis]|uniref:Endoribonuclease L-PSP n=1 Tax=Amycolatopsis saalfeldensis TaxID=394193 RepID=A0A1H8XXT6_9PSEU|nr:RidA family protein [Amycolatopsis saalfeldensis]SEP44573.1 endoribonuclease L-PSP [Amycolatopsis saalfeldensis]